MMNEELLEQLETWHEQDEYEKIVDAVQEIPTEDRDYELVNHLGRALNNLERYEEAVEQFLTVAEEGRMTRSGNTESDWLITIWSNTMKQSGPLSEPTSWSLGMKIHWSFWVDSHEGRGR